MNMCELLELKKLTRYILRPPMHFGYLDRDSFLIIIMKTNGLEKIWL